MIAIRQQKRGIYFATLKSQGSIELLTTLYVVPLDLEKGADSKDPREIELGETSIIPPRYRFPATCSTLLALHSTVPALLCKRATQ
jgi:hypothetical protein